MFHSTGGREKTLTYMRRRLPGLTPHGCRIPWTRKSGSVAIFAGNGVSLSVCISVPITIMEPKDKSAFQKMELRIPFHGIQRGWLPRNPARAVDLTQFLSASIAVYRPRAEVFVGRCDAKSGKP